jgi:hypothetical protein
VLLQRVGNVAYTKGTRLTLGWRDEKALAYPQFG